MKAGTQKLLISKCIEITGSERNLAGLLNIPKSSIYYYKFEKRNLPEARFQRLIELVDKRSKKCFQNTIICTLEDNWGRRKGGKKLIECKIKSGQFYPMITKLKRSTSKRWKKWHAMMKKENPKLYYTTLYNKFKKIGEYKYSTERGEKVRNLLEKEVADFLHNKHINYEYEQYVKIKNNVFFPDFKFRNIIIECTSWRGYDKAKKLKKKIKYYRKMNYAVFVLIPSKLRRYYQSIKEYTITDVSELPL